jgi:uncharacterized membrane protein YecN with MAPEG domain
MNILITGFYAALLAIVGIVLAGLVGATRARKKTISLGDGGDAEMLEAMRRHLNFVEYVPLALILMACVEINGGSASLLHGLGLVLFIGRLIHPFGISAKDMMLMPRVIGIVATFGVMTVASGVLVWQFVR